jgi:hypothetical protein
MQSVLNCRIHILERKQDSVFDIVTRQRMGQSRSRVTRQRMGQSRSRVSFPDKERNLLFSGSGLHLACY